MPQEVLSSQSYYQDRISDLFAHGTLKSSSLQMKAISLAGMSLRREDGKPDALYQRVRRLYAGLHSAEKEIVFSAVGRGYRISYYFGFPAASGAYAAGVLSGALEDPECSDLSSLPDSQNMAYSGCMTGMPSLPKDNTPWANPMDVISQGMLGADFTLLFRCVPMDASNLTGRLNQLNSFLKFHKPKRQFNRSGTIFLSIHIILFP